MKYGGMSPTKQHSQVAELVRRASTPWGRNNEGLNNGSCTGSNPVLTTKKNLWGKVFRLIFVV